MDSPKLKWSVTNDENSVTLLEVSERACDAYIDTPTVAPSEKGYGWEIKATGLSLLLRLATTIIMEGEKEVIWPHWELYNGVDWNSSKAPIFVRCFKESDLRKNMQIPSPQIDCSKEATWVISTSGLSLGLCLQIYNE